LGDGTDGRAILKALIVDSDETLARLLERELHRDGFTVHRAASRADGVQLCAATAYDLLLIDWNLPDGSGLDVLASFRAAGHTGSVILVTVDSTIELRVAGLDAGADDFLVKPFELRELRARIRAVFRRPQPWTREVYSVGDLIVDGEGQCATVRDGVLDLTQKEWRVLRLLARQPGRVVSRAELVMRAWEDSPEPDSNALNVHISNLRAKLSALGSTVAIRARRGAGFQLVLS